MEGLQAVELNLNELESGIRIDAELYKKDLVLFEKRMKMAKYTLLGNEVKLIKKGIFDIKSDCYTDKGVPFVRISNLKNQVIDMSNIVYIPESENIKNLNTALVRNDIILSKTANAAASLVNIQLCNTSQDTVAIKLKEDSLVNSHFVVTYLNTSHGLKQMQRWFTGNIQMHLNLEDCKNNLLIPIYSSLFQNKIKELFENAISISSKSQTTYTQAETFLLQEIGLENFEPSKEPVNIKSFKESFGVTGRLDSEYYQTKYEDYLNLIFNYKNGYEKISKICELKDSNFSPELTEKYKYIELSNIGKTGEVNGYTEEFGKDLPTRARRIVYSGDVIISSIEGSLQSCAVIQNEFNKALCSTGFYVVKSDSINSETLLVLFKSELLQAIMKQNCSGTILTGMNKDEFSKIPIPIVDSKKQIKIAELVKASFKLKTESERLLEVAKKAVEMAIEEGEDKAMEYIINNQK